VSLASSTVSVSPETTESEVLVAHGVLSRNGKAGTVWILKTNNSLRFRDEAILEVTFTTRAGEDSIAYAAYEGKQVELVGEVKEVFHGNAILRNRTKATKRSIAFSLTRSSGISILDQPTSSA
jgi:hypothetical protein